MSKIAKKPIEIPVSVTVTVTGNQIAVKGPKGELEAALPPVVQVKDNFVVIEGDSQMTGMSRTMIFNMVKGVSEGWSKTLELSGTGFRAQVTGKQLQLALGFSHPVSVDAPEGITFEVKENKISVMGADRALIGEVADKIRKLKPADVYKHKGFKYEGEKLIKKAGKAAKAGAVAAK
ncbi:MAG: large subunit ribosomal protein L6 [Microgenomates group bacterium Gr01-1014_16]|nr:MAG: large subunit ribosomal protein L6 [Microgenomates group bacterium Gr01-1014_16]